MKKTKPNKIKLNGKLRKTKLSIVSQTVVLSGQKRKKCAVAKSRYITIKRRTDRQTVYNRPISPAIMLANCSVGGPAHTSGCFVSHDPFRRSYVPSVVQSFHSAMRWGLPSLSYGYDRLPPNIAAARSAIPFCAGCPMLPTLFTGITNVPWLNHDYLINSCRIPPNRFSDLLDCVALLHFHQLNALF